LAFIELYHIDFWLFLSSFSLLGHDLIKESLRIEQVRDLFGIRAVDEVRQEFGIV